MIDAASIRALLTEGVAERPWLTTATVIGTQLDDEGEAVWVDVKVEATGLVARCRLASGYTGPGYGLYVLPQPGVEAVVAFPSTGIPEQQGHVLPDLSHGVVLGLVDNDEAKIPEGIDAATLLLVLAPSHRVVVRKQGGDELVTIDAGSGAVMVQATTVTVEASSVELKASQVQIHGGLVRLADGAQPVARVADAVQAGPFAGTVIGPGNPNVLS